jgi:hypothetical protein
MPSHFNGRYGLQTERRVFKLRPAGDGVSHRPRILGGEDEKATGTPRTGVPSTEFLIEPRQLDKEVAGSV